MQPEPVTTDPPRDFDRVVFRQRWEDLLFLHWAVDPERVRPHLPPGVEPDVHDGATYVGLIPFRMRDIAFGPTPPVPYLGTFLETNVRLYSVDPAGRRGVVFVSLDASRLVPVLAARGGPRLPYLWSRMSYTRRLDHVEATCVRRWPGPRGARSRIAATVGDVVEGDGLATFLTARWGLHATDWRGRTRYWPNRHARWALQTATVTTLDDELLAAAGFGGLTDGAPDSVLFSRGVDVTFGSRID